MDETRMQIRLIILVLCLAVIFIAARTSKE